MTERKVRIAALADIHYGEGGREAKTGLLAAAAAAADIVLICGDMTANGTAAQAELMAADLREQVHVPCLGVLGNHDYESNQAAEVREALESGGMTVLDGECAEVLGIGFTGVCGFGGGFGKYMLNAWGEPLIKEFVNAAVAEALKLEKALARMVHDPRVVLLHYAPIVDTVVGEPAEIYPFLGSSRLEGPLNRHAVTTVCHGHAHSGTPEGRTMTGIPVYNVAISALAAAFPGQPTFRLLEIAVQEDRAAQASQ